MGAVTDHLLRFSEVFFWADGIFVAYIVWLWRRNPSVMA